MLSEWRLGSTGRNITCWSLTSSRGLPLECKYAVRNVQFLPPWLGQRCVLCCSAEIFLYKEYILVTMLYVVKQLTLDLERPLSTNKDCQPYCRYYVRGSLQGNRPMVTLEITKVLLTNTKLPLRIRRGKDVWTC